MLWSGSAWRALTYWLSPPHRYWVAVYLFVFGLAGSLVGGLILFFGQSEGAICAARWMPLIDSPLGADDQITLGAVRVAPALVRLVVDSYSV